MHAIMLIVLPLAIEAAAIKGDSNRERGEVREVVAMLLPPEEPEPEEPEPQMPSEPSPEEEKPKEVELGIDAPTPPSETWIGHEEPIPQLAEKFETEQAAFVDEPVAATTPPPQEALPAQEPQPEVQLQETPQQPVDDRVTASQQLAPPGEDDIANESPEEEEGSPTQEMEGDVEYGAGDLNNVQPRIEKLELPELDRLQEAVRNLLNKMQEVVEESLEKPGDGSENLETENDQDGAAAGGESQPPQQLQQPSEPQPQIAPEAQQSPREEGTPADKESSPTSTIDVPREQWQLGKPLARQGLQLKPRRPEFALLTLLTASPGNPICIISFANDGVPRNATLVRTSGDKRVDDAILASLYRWRAEGAQLQQLADGKLLDVQMRIVLNKRAAVTEDSRADVGRTGN